MTKQNEIKQPFKSQEELEYVLREISSKEQVYSIALFDILGFSNFVETNGNQVILEFLEKSYTDESGMIYEDDYEEVSA